MITTAMKAAIEELVPPFERASGHKLRVVYGPSGGLARRFNGGEVADLIVVDSKVLDELIKQGKVVAGRTDVARTGIGIAVRKGAPKPDVSSADALKRALLAAKSIGHTAPAGGGVTAAHIIGVFEKLGIAAEVTPKVKLAAGGPDGRVSVLISSGQAEIGLQLVSELMSNPEVEVIGMLPRRVAADRDHVGGHHHRRPAAGARAGADPPSRRARGDRRSTRARAWRCRHKAAFAMSLLAKKSSCEEDGCHRKSACRFAPILKRPSRVNPAWVSSPRMTTFSVGAVNTSRSPVRPSRRTAS